MNRLQNSIVRFLKYVIDLENLIILLNIGQSILHSRQVPSIVFLFCRKPLNRDVYLSRNGRNLKLLLLFYYYYHYYYFIPIYVATEHKSHSNLTTRTYKPEDNLNTNKTSEMYKIQHLDYTALTADPNLFARPPH